MGVAKAGLESTSRYLARDLGPQGIRVNLVVGRAAEDPGRQGDPRLRGLRVDVERPAPRSAGTRRTTTPTAQAVCALLSDFFPATTGEIVHVDGGFHAMGA